MKRRSSKQSALLARYGEIRSVFMAQHRYCEIRWDRDCLRLATDVDHKVRRNHLADEQFLDPRWWQAACRPCHQQKETHLEEAHRRGLALHHWEIG